ncbi:carbohydrate esterase family 16 protein [Auriscalpium vulgare]|uniref:Carbohydrate esterase family 16 protein n=1 Tax=Auriscalpium vulgare TaxID=40419 RepID=A0ACB8RFH0_9AGAM|nr:carbohydrate esterase family 16 protein [Auriscalpium vulgare]
MLRLAALSLAALGLALSPVEALEWGSTKNLFVFGDSYTTTGWNISAGILSPVPGFTSSNGPNWVQALTARYNVTDTAVFNLAYGGATIDSKLVTPYLPTVQSVVTQVGLWKQFLSPPPAEARWTGDDSLFAIWIGSADVGNSWSWTNVSGPAFHTTLMNRLFGQIDTLYASGARHFLFLDVPPLERTPLFIEQGSAAVALVRKQTLDYNAQLTARAHAFAQTHRDATATVFRASDIFNTLLDNAGTLGFVNITGYSEAYENGTPTQTTQAVGFAPVSSFFWLNTLHPLFTVHDILAKAISTALS